MCVSEFRVQSVRATVIAYCVELECAALSRAIDVCNGTHARAQQNLPMIKEVHLWK